MRKAIEISVRLLKGAYYTFILVLWGVGLSIELLLLPFFWLAALLFGENPDRMQKLHRALMGVWLKLFALGGLMRVKPIKGEIYDGACVVVANHPGLYDVIVLITQIPRLSMLVKPSLAIYMPLGPIFRLSGYLLRGGLDSPEEAMNTIIKAGEIVNKGWKFLIFPEGTRSPKGGLLPFKAGAFKIAQRANVPIQPVVIRNLPPFRPKEDRWYMPSYETSIIELEFLFPIPPPPPGQERKAAAELEKLYRETLRI